MTVAYLIIVLQHFLRKTMNIFNTQCVWLEWDANHVFPKHNSQKITAISMYYIVDVIHTSVQHFHTDGGHVWGTSCIVQTHTCLFGTVNK